MNGVGPDTVVVMHDPYPVAYAKTLAVVSTILFVGCLAVYIVKRRKFIQENGKKKDIA